MWSGMNDQETRGDDRPIVVKRLTAPSTWIALTVALLGQMLPLYLYPDQPAAAMAGYMFGCIAAVLALSIAEHSAVTSEIRG